MIRFRSGDTPPLWCELRAFDILAPAPGGTLPMRRRCPRERLLISRGRCQVADASGSMVLRAGQFCDPAGESWTVAATTDEAELVRLSGTWGDEIAGCGLWTVLHEPEVANPGDPVDYPKTTRMDSHFHDHDEYWIVLEGAATAVVSGRSARLAAGDCLAIGTGHPHDLPQVHPTMRGVFFETTLMRRKRLGHLWEHTHGPAEPDPHRT